MLTGMFTKYFVDLVFSEMCTEKFLSIFYITHLHRFIKYLQ